MNQLDKRRFVKRNFWQLVLSVVAAAVLLILYVKAQPVDPEKHDVLMSDLRELQRRDTELAEAVLQHHYQLYHNYDGVVAIMSRMQALADTLALRQDDGSLPDTPEVMRVMSLLQQQIDQKADALEEFKSHNAVIKNSFLYLPRHVNGILAQISFSNIEWHELFEFLLRDSLLVAVNQSDEARRSLKQSIAEIDRVIPALPKTVKASAELASSHAKLILEHENLMEDLLGKLASEREDGPDAKLEQLYLDHYRAQQDIATSYRLLLLLAAMLMLGYATYSYYRMKGREQQLRIAAAAFETQEGILITDQDHRIIQVNQAFTHLTGYSPEEAYGQTPELLKSGRHNAGFYPGMWETIARDKYWQGEVWSRRKNGEIYPAWLTTTAVTAADQQVTHYVSVFADITLRKEAEEQIHQLAFYDSLTNLPNRRLLMDRLNHTMAAGTRNVGHGAILFIDLDNFKTLNDTKGHDVGDMLLVETARRLQESVRGGDTVTRLGGDEFIVMLEGLGGDAEQAATQAQAAGENIRESLSQPYWLRDAEYTSTCSIGISLFHGQDTAVEDLLKRADTAMYEAKASGRNALRFFDPSMQAALETRAMLEADLNHALAGQQFSLFFQIQVNVANQPIGAEALLRWRHPTKGLVLPNEFIPLAEETGLILPIGIWVLETACAQIREWEADPLACGLQLAVNVSARQFHQPDFVELVREVLDRTGADPTRLKLELTESVVLGNIGDTVAKMHELKGIGVRFSMDDFGTGYSSLSYLTRLPLDQMKIDQSFVRNIGKKSTDSVIVQTVIGMANNLGMEVIAEGVETDAQRAFLEHAGCMAYQGYLYGSPVPLEVFEEMLRQGDFLHAGIGTLHNPC
ncbi:MAG TPA: EAL domain-containing protein [Gallionella sp.]|nr:EAL domain-containing protein [Gallionella sp.]